jgi:hypothetical protein
MGTARSAAGPSEGRLGSSENTSKPRRRLFFVACLVLFAYVLLVWHSEFSIFTLEFVSFANLVWNFRVSLYAFEGTVPYQNSAQMSCREEVGVFFVALGILKSQHHAID